MRAARSAVLFSGGVGHPFEASSSLFAELIEAEGWAVRIETDLDQALALLPEVDLLAINALYWSMTQHEKYALLRAEWARSLSDAQMDAIEGFVHCGGHLFVLHTGTICWDTQPRWHALMGGGWNWETSHHPPLGPVTVDLTLAGARFSDGARQFELIDEAYHNLAPAPDCSVLATADLGHGPQPLAWVRNVAEGKVAVDALGHDDRSLREPGHRSLIRGQLQWLRA